MNIAILGTGVVGRILSEKLLDLGHRVIVGTRDVNLTLSRDLPDAMGYPPFKNWYERHPEALIASFAEAASQGEVIINAISGKSTLDALRSAGTSLDGKILIDLSNPLDFSKGMPPSLFICNTSSLGEEIQNTFPKVKVVKTLNTLGAELMVDPFRLNHGEHSIFVSGNDLEARKTVAGYLEDWFGWKDVIDLGDITTARGTEMFLSLWLRVYATLKTANFQIKIVR